MAKFKLKYQNGGEIPPKKKYSNELPVVNNNPSETVNNNNFENPIDKYNKINIGKKEIEKEEKELALKIYNKRKNQNLIGIKGSKKELDKTNKDYSEYAAKSSINEKYKSNTQKLKDIAEIGLDVASFNVGKVGKLAYIASLPFTTKDVTESIKKDDYKQAGIDALGYIPAIHHFTLGQKGEKIFDKTSKINKQYNKINNIVNTVNLSNDIKSTNILNTEWAQKKELFQSKNYLKTKNKFLNTTDDFGKMEEGIVDINGKERFPNTYRDMNNKKKYGGKINKYKFGGITKDDFLNAGASYVNYLGATAGGALGNQDLIPEVGMTGDQATKDRWAKRSDIAENVGGMIGSTGAKIALSSVGVPPQVTALGQTAIGGATKGMTDQYNPERGYKFGGNVDEFVGESHENGGVNFAKNSEAEGGERKSGGIIHSISYKFNKWLDKGLKMNNIDISKHIGKTPSEAIAIEDKRYPREGDKYTDNALKREKQTGVGKFAVENASAMIGNMVNPQPTMAKYGGKMKYDLGGPFDDPSMINDFANQGYNDFWGDSNEQASFRQYNQDEINRINIDNTNPSNPGITTPNPYQNETEVKDYKSNFNQTSLDNYNKDKKSIIDENKSSALAGNNNTYNSIGNLSSFIGPAYDVARGLKGGDAVNYERVNPDLVDYSESRNQAKSEIKGNFRETQRKFKDVNNPATYLGLTANAAGQRDKAVSNMLAQSFENEANTNAQLKNQAKYANATTQRLEADARQQEKDQSSNVLSTGLYNTGSAGVQYGIDNKKYIDQEDSKKYIGSIDYSPIYEKGKIIGYKHNISGKIYEIR